MFSQDIPSDVFLEFARKFFQIAEKDFERSLKAFQDQDWSDTVFHAQQCVEKCVKAMLEVKGRYSYDHGPQLITLFIECFQNEWRDEYRILIEAISFLYGYYTFSRYPKLIGHRVVSPFEEITKEIAEKAIEYARKVLEICRKYLSEKGIIK